MSDNNFIPLNQSTPVRDRWNVRNSNQNQSGYLISRHHNGNRRKDHQKWTNNSHRNSSFGSDSNSSYNRDNRNTIDAYLHPSMLQDPWAHLKRNE